MVKMYNEFYDLDVVKRTKDLIDLPQGMIVKKFNILYGNDISDLAEGSVVMVADIKLKTLGFFRKNKDENTFNIRDRGANWDVVFMDVTSHTGLDFDTNEYFKEDEQETDVFLEEKSTDVVSNPSHYTYANIEIIDIVEQITSQYPSDVAFAIGNVVKYVSRAPHKNKSEDLNKAMWYLQRAIDKYDKE